MAAPMSIPRFLLPQTGLIWRRTANLGGLKGPEILLVRRYASTTRAKPIVLEKPEKFNPPSHGARLPKKTTPRHYGGPLTDEEANIQKRKEYPGLMAPKDTWAHWFWHSQGLHLFISIVSRDYILGTAPLGTSTDYGRVGNLGRVGNVHLHRELQEHLALCRDAARSLRLL